MTFLDLCAGFGGFSLGLEAAGMICKGQVEIDDYCSRVLAKHWPHVPRWGDITGITPDSLPAVDLIAGGYPCQPFSLSGKRKGTADDRHLWPFICQIVAHIRPSWCLFENVAGHITLGLDQVLSDLEGEGYTAVPLDVPACGVDAPHIRRRIWILAHTECPKRRESEPGGNDAHRQAPEWQEAAGRPGASGTTGGERVLADAKSIRRSKGRSRANTGGETQFGGNSGVILPHTNCIDGDNAGLGTSQIPVGGPAQNYTWGAIQGNGLSEPGLGGSHDGLSGRLESMRQAWQDGSWEDGIPRTVPPRTLNRVARCTGIGNAVVPYLPMVFGRFIKAAHYGYQYA